MEHGQEPNGAGGRGVLEGAFLLLAELTRLGEAGLTRLAAGAGLPKATAHRLLGQLVAVGAVQRGAGRYRIGPRLYGMGQAWQPAHALREAARQPLRQLAAAVRGASVNVAVPAGGRTLVVGTVRGEADDAIAVHPGMQFPHGVGQDRLWAAYTAGAATPPPYSAAEWERLVTDVRERNGLVLNYECPYVPAVSTVGAAVRTSFGAVVASVSARVLDNRRLTSMAPAVRHAAGRVGANLTRLATADPALRSWLAHA